ncbi:MAG: hypothetical protein JXM71_07790, partial [Spirochaetales bacterium]|nr:hypothetical protein [Spirochaetales bacterium]
DDVIVVVSAMGRRGAPYATDTLLGLLDASSVTEPTAHAPNLARDLIASCGETISACLIAALLDARGCPAEPLTAYTAGIRASGPYGDADIVELDPAKIKALLAAGVIPVVTGFQAVSPDGTIVTIGRGGSDTSAVAIGAWTGADYVDIFTDVPGVAVADPRVVPEAPYMARLDYRSMYRLASHGARVLHDRSALLGERFNVTIRVRSTFDDGNGTIISAEPLPDNAPAVLGIASSVAGDRARVTVVCGAGRAAAVSTGAMEAAQRCGATAVPLEDADALAFECPAESSPTVTRELFNALFSA